MCERVTLRFASKGRQKKVLISDDIKLELFSSKVFVLDMNEVVVNELKEPEVPSKVSFFSRLFGKQNRKSEEIPIYLFQKNQFEQFVLDESDCTTLENTILTIKKYSDEDILSPRFIKRIQSFLARVRSCDNINRKVYIVSKNDSIKPFIVLKKTVIDL